MKIDRPRATERPAPAGGPVGPPPSVSAPPSAPPLNETGHAHAHGKVTGAVVDNRPVHVVAGGTSARGVQIAATAQRKDARLSDEARRFLKDAAKECAKPKSTLADHTALRELAVELNVTAGFDRILAANADRLHDELFAKAADPFTPLPELRALRDVARAMGRGEAFDAVLVASFAGDAVHDAGRAGDRAAQVGLGDALRAATKVDVSPAVVDTVGIQHPPASFPAFPDLVRARPKTPVQGGGGLRRRWTDEKANLYEWDSQHGKLEKYTSKGKHVGEYDGTTGARTKPPDPTRSIEP